MRTSKYVEHVVYLLPLVCTQTTRIPWQFRSVAFSKNPNNLVRWTGVSFKGTPMASPIWFVWGRWVGIQIDLFLVRITHHFQPRHSHLCYLITIHRYKQWLTRRGSRYLCVWGMRGPHTSVDSEFSSELTWQSDTRVESHYTVIMQFCPSDLVCEKPSRCTG